jgi:glutamine amidotransferase
VIAIIDYDAGNLRSVEKALHFLNEETIITRDKNIILNSDKVILPGVGSFGVAMDKLHSYDLVDTIRDVIENKKPLLGICLGLQLLYESSTESDGVRGLGILKGTICKIPDCTGLKIPHIGWNSLEIKSGAKLFKGIDNGSYVYFVHSFYLRATNIEEVAATSEYSTTIHASIEKDNVYACQFHPEKSGEIGLNILKNFASL